MTSLTIHPTIISQEQAQYFKEFNFTILIDKCNFFNHQNSYMNTSLENKLTSFCENDHSLLSLSEVLILDILYHSSSLSQDETIPLILTDYEKKIFMLYENWRTPKAYLKITTEGNKFFGCRLRMYIVKF